MASVTEFNKLSVKVFSARGIELSPTTPKRARDMIKSGAAYGRRKAETDEFYIEMKIPVRAERQGSHAGSNHVIQVLSEAA